MVDTDLVKDHAQLVPPPLVKNGYPNGVLDPKAQKKRLEGHDIPGDPLAQVGERPWCFTAFCYRP